MNDNNIFDSISFGMRLKKIREFNNYTQEEIAELVGVSPRSVRNWESGKKIPGIDNVVELSKYFGLAVGEILEDEPYRIFEKKATARKRSIEIVEAEGLIEFYVEFTEDRYFDRYEVWIWDELSRNKFCYSTTDKVVGYDFLKKSILDERFSIAADYRQSMLKALSEDDDDERWRKEQLALKMKCEQAGMAHEGAAFVNGIVNYFGHNLDDI